MSSEQTEKATPKKRQTATEKGDRLLSRELVSAAALVSGIVALGAVGSHWITTWRLGYQRSLELAFLVLGRERGPLEIAGTSRSIALQVMYPMVAIGIAACGAAVLTGVAQGAGQLKFASISPRWSRLNPASNAKQIFSQQSFVRFLKSCLPVAAIGLIALEKMSSLQTLPVLSLSRLPATFQAVYDVLLGAAVIMLAWSSVDFVSAWRAREKRLRMSKQDVKDESKESEGSPQVKRRIRMIQRQMRGRKLKADVSKATVVVTNPTHYAVALSFDFETMATPRLLAKGKDILAAEIREQARWAGIPIIENPPLARSLYKMVEQGRDIPFELYAAVAGILAYLYRSEVEQRLRRSAAVVTRNPANRAGSSPDPSASPGSAPVASRAPLTTSS